MFVRSKKKPNRLICLSKAFSSGHNWQLVNSHLCKLIFVQTHLWLPRWSQSNLSDLSLPIAECILAQNPILTIKLHSAVQLYLSTIKLYNQLDVHFQLWKASLDLRDRDFSIFVSYYYIPTMPRPIIFPSFALGLVS